jgi:sugar lactone lactonase YvrE
MTRRSLAVSLALVCALAALAVPAAASAAFGPLGAFGTIGVGAGELESPGNLAVSPDGSIYVADYSNNRVDVFGTDGSFRFAFGANVDPAGGNVCTPASGCRPGESSGGAGGMKFPESVALDEEGNVYVADTSNSRIDVFTADGAFIRAFGAGVNPQGGGGDVCTAATGCETGAESGAAGGLDLPRGLDVSGSTVYVADTANNRIAVYGTDGTFRYVFGADVNENGTNVCAAGESCKAGLGGSAAGELHEPQDVKSSSSGYLVVSDNRNDRIAVYEPDGTFVRAMGKGVNVKTSGDVCTVMSGCGPGVGFGGAAGSMSRPTAMAVDAADDVFVADSGFERIDEWTLEGTFVKAWGAGVIDGAEAFQVCTTETGCTTGRSGSTLPGALSQPDGVAVDCQGGIWTAEAGTIQRIQHFGEAETSTPPPCPAPVHPGGGEVPQSSNGSGPSPAPVTGPSNAIKLGKVKLNKKKGAATLAVTVPGPGKLVLSGKGLKKATRTAKKAGSVSFVVKATGKAAKTLAKVGKVKLEAKVSFTPTGGTPGSQTKKLTLKKTLG